MRTKLFKGSARALIALGVVVIALGFAAGRYLAVATVTGFTFTATGDYGATEQTTATLNGIARTRPSFNLALGDFSYGTLTPERVWCAYVTSNVGVSFPFELLAGNHEDYDTNPISGVGGNIDNFLSCLPDKIGRITGVYGKEYYFDYPASNPLDTFIFGSPTSRPLARFINISPNIALSSEPNGISGRYWKYLPGNQHYTWLVDAIDSARAAGIPWIIVAMHMNYISMGLQGNAIGTPLNDLLIQKKVDLVLQANDHSYQRSKQLALNTTSCTSIPANAYNSSCLVRTGTKNAYVKGQGTVLVIVGTAGASLTQINGADPEAGYFTTWMGRNINPSYGFLQVDVSDTEMSASFIRSAGGSYADGFIINSAGRVTHVVDHFSRQVVGGWAAANVGGAYTHYGPAADFGVNGTTGTMRFPTAGSTRTAYLLDVTARDVDIAFKIGIDKLPTGGDQYTYFGARRSSNGNKYLGRLRFAPNGYVYLQAAQSSADSQVLLGSEVRVPNASYTPQTYIRLRGQVVGANPTTIRLKAWLDGQAEPVGWQYSVTNSEAVLQGAGAVGLQGYLSSSVTNVPIILSVGDVRVNTPSTE